MIRIKTALSDSHKHAGSAEREVCEVRMTLSAPAEAAMAGFQDLIDDSAVLLGQNSRPTKGLNGRFFDS